MPAGPHVVLLGSILVTFFSYLLFGLATPFGLKTVPDPTFSVGFVPAICTVRRLSVTWPNSLLAHLVSYCCTLWCFLLLAGAQSPYGPCHLTWYSTAMVGAILLSIFYSLESSSWITMDYGRSIDK